MPRLALGIFPIDDENKPIDTGQMYAYELPELTKEAVMQGAWILIQKMVGKDNSGPVKEGEVNDSDPRHEGTTPIGLPTLCSESGDSQVGDGGLLDQGDGKAGNC